MEIISNYEEKKPKKNLLYLAKPIYGGWVTFTAHLSKKYDYPIYKITKNSEKKKRKFGYDCEYHNLNMGEILKLDNILITAVDKHYWKYLSYFPDGTNIVIHDPTECKKTKDGNPLVQNIGDKESLLKSFNITTIRRSVQEYLLKNYELSSRYLLHPFYEYKNCKEGLKYKNVSISRLDFDKNTDIILKANENITESENKIYCFGAENRIYVHHKLKTLNIASLKSK